MPPGVGPLGSVRKPDESRFAQSSPREHPFRVQVSRRKRIARRASGAIRFGGVPRFLAPALPRCRDRFLPARAVACRARPPGPEGTRLRLRSRLKPAGIREQHQDPGANEALGLKRDRRSAYGEDDKASHKAIPRARRSPNPAEPEPRGLPGASDSGPRASGQTQVRRARIRPCPGSEARSPKPKSFPSADRPPEEVRAFAHRRRALAGTLGPEAREPPEARRRGRPPAPMTAGEQPRGAAASRCATRLPRFLGSAIEDALQPGPLESQAQIEPWRQLKPGSHARCGHVL
jgi:hypothetical protein